MSNKHIIYKTDKWNMMTVEVQGKSIVVREISDRWGEETHTFLGRPAMMQWVTERFRKEDYAGREHEWEKIIESFRSI